MIGKSRQQLKNNGDENLDYWEKKKGGIEHRMKFYLENLEL